MKKLIRITVYLVASLILGVMACEAKTGRGVPIMVNQLLEASHSPLPLCVSASLRLTRPPAFPTHFQVPYAPRVSLDVSGNFLGAPLVPISKNRAAAGQEASSHVRP